MQLEKTKQNDNVWRTNNCNPFQSANRTGHSTETARLRVGNNLQNATDKDRVSVLHLLDLVTAFNTIDHRREFFFPIWKLSLVSVLLLYRHHHPKPHLLGFRGPASKYPSGNNWALNKSTDRANIYPCHRVGVNQENK